MDEGVRGKWARGAPALIDGAVRRVGTAAVTLLCTHNGNGASLRLFREARERDVIIQKNSLAPTARRSPLSHKIYFKPHTRRKTKRPRHFSPRTGPDHDITSD